MDGFYKLDGELLYSQCVIGPDYCLFLNDKDSYSYPVEGWYYFDTEEEAKAFFNL